MPLTFEQFKQLRNKGLSNEQIIQFESGYQPNKEVSQKPQQSTLSKIVTKPAQSAIGFVGKTVGLAERGIEKTGLPTAVGFLGRKTGQVIGGATGAIGQTLIEAYKTSKTGKLPKDLSSIKKATLEQAKDVGDFAEQVTHGGALAAPFAGLGKIPSMIIAAPILYKGIKDKDAVEIAISSLAMLGAKYSKGKILDPQFTGGVKTLFKSGFRGSVKVGQKVGVLPNEIKAIDNLEQTYIELAQSTKPTKTALEKSKLRTQFKNEAGTEGENAVRILAKDRIIPKQSGNKLNTFEQANDYRKLVIPLDEKLNQLLELMDKYSYKNNIDDLKTKAIELANSESNINRGIADELEKRVTKAFDDYKLKIGEDVTNLRLNQIKASRWGKIKTLFEKMNDPLKSDEDYIIGKVIQEQIETNAKNLGAPDVAQLNRIIGDKLDAATFLQKLDGKVIKGGTMGKYTMRIIGSQLSSNPLGKILGAMGGDFISNILIDLSIANPVKRLILAIIKEKEPIAYTNAIKWLNDNAIELQSTKNIPRLPAGTTIYTPEGGFTPRESKLFSQREAQERLQSYKRKEPQLLLPSSAGQTKIQNYEPAWKVAPKGRTIENITKEKMVGEYTPAKRPSTTMPIISREKSMKKVEQIKPTVKQSSLIKEASKYKSAKEFINELFKKIDYTKELNIIKNFKPLKKEFGNVYIPTRLSGDLDAVRFEPKLDSALEKIGYNWKELSNMSVAEKSELVFGKDFTNKYRKFLDNKSTLSEYYPSEIKSLSLKAKSLFDGGMSKQEATNKVLTDFWNEVHKK